MGQQQLLLVILVTIIIGVAIVVAVDIMHQARTESNENSVRQDILMVLNDAKIYYQKPEMMGGGGGSFDGISKDNILSIDPDNENGSYDISGSGNSVTVNGIGVEEDIALSATATISSGDLDITWSEID